MTRWFGLLSLLALLLMGAAGCENAVTVTGNVTIPPEVQRLFSPEQPGAVEMAGTKFGGAGGTLLYLCAPTTDQPLVALVLPYSITEFGCVAEQLLEVRAYPVPSARRADVRCGESGQFAGNARLGAELAYGAATVFKGRGGGYCESGSDRADLTMALSAR